MNWFSLDNKTQNDFLLNNNKEIDKYWLLLTEDQKQIISQYENFDYEKYWTELDQSQKLNVILCNKKFNLKKHYNLLRENEVLLEYICKYKNINYDEIWDILPDKYKIAILIYNTIDFDEYSDSYYNIDISREDLNNLFYKFLFKNKTLNMSNLNNIQRFIMLKMLKKLKKIEINSVNRNAYLYNNLPENIFFATNKYGDLFLINNINYANSHLELLNYNSFLRKEKIIKILD